MSCSIHVEIEKEIVFLKISGYFKFKEVCAVIEEASTLVPELKNFTLVIDLTESNNQNYVFDFYNFAYHDSQCISKFNQWKDKIILLNKQDPSFEYFKTIISNSGIQLKVQNNDYNEADFKVKYTRKQHNIKINNN